VERVSGVLGGDVGGRLRFRAWPAAAWQQPTLFTDRSKPVYAATGSAVNLTAGIQAWYDEISDYDYDSMQCAADKPCGHYTQAGHHISVLP